MPNNQVKDFIMKKSSQEVLIIKILIIFVICFVPVSLMLLDISKNLFFKSQIGQKKNGNLTQSDEFNFRTQMPVTGDISQVPKEKIDSVFNNIKFK